jgi:protein gp37
MADIFGEWVTDNWIKEIFKACAAAPQHTYIFLTKNPQRYTELHDKGILPVGDNYWFGTTITQKSEHRRVNYLPNYFETPNPTYRNTFISAEPLQDDTIGDLIVCRGQAFRSVILGAETGNRKGKFIPADFNINLIVRCADRTDCGGQKHPVFMKDSLIPIVGKENMRRELPWKVSGK